MEQVFASMRPGRITPDNLEVYAPDLTLEELQ